MAKQPKQYVVKKGDSLAKIARKLGISERFAKLIYQRNRKLFAGGRKLQAGDVLKLRGINFKRDPESIRIGYGEASQQLGYAGYRPGEPTAGQTTTPTTPTTPTKGGAEPQMAPTKRARFEGMQETLGSPAMGGPPGIDQDLMANAEANLLGQDYVGQEPEDQKPYPWSPETAYGGEPTQQEEPGLADKLGERVMGAGVAVPGLTLDPYIEQISQNLYHAPTYELPAGTPLFTIGSPVDPFNDDIGAWNIGLPLQEPIMQQISDHQQYLQPGLTVMENLATSGGPSFWQSLTYNTFQAGALLMNKISKAAEYAVVFPQIAMGNNILPAKEHWITQEVPIYTGENQFLSQFTSPIAPPENQLGTFIAGGEPILNLQNPIGPEYTLSRQVPAYEGEMIEDTPILDAIKFWGDLLTSDSKPLVYHPQAPGAGYGYWFPNYDPGAGFYDEDAKMWFVPESEMAGASIPNYWDLHDPILDENGDVHWEQLREAQAAEVRGIIMNLDGTPKWDVIFGDSVIKSVISEDTSLKKNFTWENLAFNFSQSTGFAGIAVSLYKDPSKITKFAEGLDNNIPMAELLMQLEDPWAEAAFNTLTDPFLLIAMADIGIKVTGIATTFPELAGRIESTAKMANLIEDMSMPGLTTLRQIPKAIKKAGLTKLLSHAPVLEWLTTQSARSQRAAWVQEVGNALQTLAVRFDPSDGISATDYFARVLLDSDSVMSKLAPRQRRVLKDMINLFDEEGLRTIDELLEKFGAFEKIPGKHSKTLIKELIGSGDPKTIAYYVEQAASSLKGKRLGIKGQSRSLASTFNWAGRVLRENWLGVNPRYLTANYLDNQIKTLLSNYAPNAFNITNAEQLTRIFQHTFGLPIPEGVSTSYIADALNITTDELATGQIPLPFIGKPSQWKKTFRAVTGKAPSKPLTNFLEGESAIVKVLESANITNALNAGLSKSQSIETMARMNIFVQAYEARYFQEVLPTVLDAAWGKIPNIADNRGILKSINKMVRSYEDWEKLISRYRPGGPPKPGTYIVDLMPDNVPDTEFFRTLADGMHQMQMDALELGIHDTSAFVDDIIGRLERAGAKADEIYEATAKKIVQETRTNLEIFDDIVEQSFEVTSAVDQPFLGFSPKEQMFAEDEFMMELNRTRAGQGLQPLEESAFNNLLDPKYLDQQLAKAKAGIIPDNPVIGVLFEDIEDAADVVDVANALDSYSPDEIYQMALDEYNTKYRQGMPPLGQAQMLPGAQADEFISELDDPNNWMELASKPTAHEGALQEGRLPEELRGIADLNERGYLWYNTPNYFGTQGISDSMDDVIERIQREIAAGEDEVTEYITVVSHPEIPSGLVSSYDEENEILESAFRINQSSKGLPVEDELKMYDEFEAGVDFIGTIEVIGREGGVYPVLTLNVTRDVSNMTAEQMTEWAMEQINKIGGTVPIQDVKINWGAKTGVQEINEAMENLFKYGEGPKSGRFIQSVKGEDIIGSPVEPGSPFYTPETIDFGHVSVHNYLTNEDITENLSEAIAKWPEGMDSDAFSHVYAEDVKGVPAHYEDVLRGSWYRDTDELKFGRGFHPASVGSADQFADDAIPVNFTQTGPNEITIESIRVDDLKSVAKKLKDEGLSDDIKIKWSEWDTTTHKEVNYEDVLGNIQEIPTLDFGNVQAQIPQLSPEEVASWNARVADEILDDVQSRVVFDMKTGRFGVGVVHDEAVASLYDEVANVAEDLWDNDMSVLPAGGHPDMLELVIDNNNMTITLNSNDYFEPPRELLDALDDRFNGYMFVTSDWGGSTNFPVGVVNRLKNPDGMVHTPQIVNNINHDIYYSMISDPNYPPKGRPARFGYHPDSGMIILGDPGDPHQIAQMEKFYPLDEWAYMMKYDDGRFMVAPSHGMTIDSPPEQFLRMLEEIGIDPGTNVSVYSESAFVAENSIADWLNKAPAPSVSPYDLQDFKATEPFTRVSKAWDYILDNDLKIYEDVGVELTDEQVLDYANKHLLANADKETLGIGTSTRQWDKTLELTDVDTGQIPTGMGEPPELFWSDSVQNPNDNLGDLFEEYLGREAFDETRPSEGNILKGVYHPSYGIGFSEDFHNLAMDAIDFSGKQSDLTKFSLFGDALHFESNLTNAEELAMEFLDSGVDPNLRVIAGDWEGTLVEFANDVVPDVPTVVMKVRDPLAESYSARQKFISYFNPGTLNQPMLMVWDFEGQRVLYDPEAFFHMQIAGNLPGDWGPMVLSPDGELLLGVNPDDLEDVARKLLEIGVDPNQPIRVVHGQGATGTLQNLIGEVGSAAEEFSSVQAGMADAAQIHARETSLVKLGQDYEATKEGLAQWGNNISRASDAGEFNYRYAPGEDPDMVEALEGLRDEIWLPQTDLANSWASSEVNRILFDYNSKSNVEELLRYYSPFTTWQLRNPMFWAQAMGNTPGLINIITRYMHMSEVQRKQNYLSTRFQGTIGGRTEDGGYLGVNPNPLLSFFSQFQTPFFTPDQEAEMENTTGIAKILQHLYQGGKYLGVTPWPWISYGMEQTGVLPPATTQVSFGPMQRLLEMGLVAAGKLELGHTLTGESATGDWLVDYYINRAIVEIGAEQGLSEQEMLAALQNPGHPLYQQAEERVQEIQLQTGLYSIFSPFGAKYSSPGEIQVRQEREYASELPTYEERQQYELQHPATRMYRLLFGDEVDLEIQRVNAEYDEKLEGLLPWEQEYQDLVAERAAKLEEYYGFDKSRRQVLMENLMTPIETDDMDDLRTTVLFRLQAMEPRAGQYVQEGGDIDWETFNEEHRTYIEMIPEYAEYLGYEMDTVEYLRFKYRNATPEKIAYDQYKEWLTDAWDEYESIQPGGEGFNDALQWALNIQHQTDLAAGFTLHEADKLRIENAQTWMVEGLPYEMQQDLIADLTGPQNLQTYYSAVAEIMGLEQQTTDVIEYLSEALNHELPGMFGEQTAAEQATSDLYDYYYNLTPKEKRQVRSHFDIDIFDLTDIPEERILEMAAELRSSEFRRANVGGSVYSILAPIPDNIPFLPPADDLTATEMRELQQVQVDWYRYESNIREGYKGEWTDLMDKYYGDPNSASGRFWGALQGLILTNDVYDDPYMAAIMSAATRAAFEIDDDQYEAALKHFEENKETFVDWLRTEQIQAHPEWLLEAQKQSVQLTKYKNIEMELVKAEYYALGTQARRDWRTENADQYQELRDYMKQQIYTQVEYPYYLYVYKPWEYKKYYGSKDPHWIDSADAERLAESLLKAFEDADYYATTGEGYSQYMKEFFGPSPADWRAYSEDVGEIYNNPVLMQGLITEYHDMSQGEQADWRAEHPKEYDALLQYWSENRTSRDKIWFDE